MPRSRPPQVCVERNTAIATDAFARTLRECCACGADHQTISNFGPREVRGVDVRPPTRRDGRDRAQRRCFEEAPRERREPGSRWMLRRTTDRHAGGLDVALAGVAPRERAFTEGQRLDHVVVGLKRMDPVVSLLRLAAANVP